MEKEGKFNLKFIFAIGFLLILMSFFSFGVVVTLNAPTDGSINTSVTRNINFTFTPTWNATGEVIGNCTLYTNFSGTWQSAIEFNGSSLTQENNGSSNITNGSLSWVNYTFTRDLSNFVWNIGCYNGTGTALVLNFSTNRTLAIDVVAPAVVQTADIFSLFNTSSATPTITVNITDGGNGTGVDLTNGANEVLNITLFDVNTGADSQLVKYNTSNSSFTCTPTGNGAQIFQCTLNIANSPLTNGTKNLTVNVKDKANLTNQSSFLFTVDQIAPVPHYFNVTNASTFNASGWVGENGTFDNRSAVQLGELNPANVPTSGIGTWTQGRRLYTVSNWTDNITQVFQAEFQAWNFSSGSWVILSGIAYNAANTTNVTSKVNGEAWANLSAILPTGHNIFEGRNITFRVVVNDSVGNRGNSTNITVLINDSTKPTLSLSVDAQGRPDNFTNISTTTPTIVWNVTESNFLSYVALQIDGSTSQACNRFANFTLTDGLAEEKRNGTLTVTSGGSCPLSNGTHAVRLTVEDTWGNSELYIHNFTITTVTPPTLNLQVLSNFRSAINQSNITPYTAINLTSTRTTSTQQIKNLTFTSSCNSTLQNFVNPCLTCASFNQSIYPFNYSQGTCKGTEANQTVTVTVTDVAGNSNTTVFGFFVDDKGPSIALNSPTNGLLVVNELTSINFSVKDNGMAVSTIGYFLDEKNLTILNISDSIGAGAGANTSSGSSINITPVGTRRFKLTANDTLGNSANGSIITFTIQGPINTAGVNTSLSLYLANVTALPSNATIKLKGAGGEYTTVSNVTDSSGTFEILLQLNSTSALDQINVTITEINGSAANWDKINFSAVINDSTFEAGVENNFTATLLKFVIFNDSIEQFLPNSNDYFGTVLLPLNISGNLSTAQEIWFFANASSITTRINVSQCTAAYTRTTTAPCWNYSTFGKTLVFVPHFSGVGAGNDSTAPSTTINTPSTARGNQSIGVFEFNISVSQDTVNCRYSINATAGTANVTMTKTGTTCMGQTEFFKNNDGKYNITFYATDASNNIGTTVFHLNVSDTGAPITSGDITSSPSTTTASVSVSANETVNVTVNFGTSNATLGTKAHETDFNLSQSVSLASLTASTTYFYNVTICDFNGNCLTNGSFTFTTSAAAAAAAAASTSSGSSGGGGGAAAPSNVAAETSKKWDALAGGSSATLTINNANIAVTGVVIDVKSAVTNAEIKVASLVASPFTAAAETKIYQYLQLTKSNIADTDASKITINFKVPKSWLSTNAVAEGDIVLYRYSDSKWNALETAMTGSDTDNILYSSVTPGFSTFAIGSKEAAPAAPAAETPAEVPAAPAEEAAPAAPAAETPAEEAMEKKGLSSTAIAWIVVAVIVVVAAVGYTMMKRKEK